MTIAASLGALMLLLLLLAASMPNLLRSRTAADRAAQSARSRAQTGDFQAEGLSGGGRAAVGGAGKLVAAAYVGDLQTPFLGRKVVQTATMELVVADPRQTTRGMEDLAQRYGGYVENSTLEEDVQGRQTGSVVLRVPSDRFAAVREQLRGMAQQVEKDQAESQDVTRQFVDFEAELRNDRAEEQQYLEIMKRAGTIKDTVAVTEKLSEVRGRIEHLQGELQFLSHQVEMSSISVRCWKEPQVSEARFQWHPWLNARDSWRNAAEALAGYVDSMVTLLLYIPVVLAWGFTIVAVAYGSIRILVAVGKRLLPRRAEAAAPAALR